MGIFAEITSRATYFSAFDKQFRKERRIFAAIIKQRRMVLNYIWIGFFAIAFIVALIRLLFWGELTVFTDLVNATFDSSKTAFELSLGLTGILSLWLGIMKIGERSGLIAAMANRLSPVLTKLFPDIPKGHPVMGSMFMNMVANMLGLDNAATPLGLRAMEELQTLNPKKDTASNPMIMFLVINTSGLMLIPITIMVYRAQMGAAQPTDVFIPILLSTLTSTLAGVLIVSISQRIRLWCRGLVIFMLCLSLFVAGLIYLFVSLPQAQINTYSTLAANILLFTLIIWFIVSGFRKRLNVFDAFVDGAKDGFKTAVRIIPYLVAFLVSIAVFRVSGAMGYLVDGIGAFFGFFGMNTDFVGALPTGMMKSLSGSGANGLMIDAMSEYGADSFVGRTASVVRGASDTTFYILAVYFGSVGISRTRNAVTCGLFADFIGVVAAITFSYLFFH
jgi:spore maturation protein SpmA